MVKLTSGKLGLTLCRLKMFKSLTHAESVASAETKIYAFLNVTHRAFVNFVLSNYIKADVDELIIEKLPLALISNYGGMYVAD